MSSYNPGPLAAMVVFLVSALGLFAAGSVAGGGIALGFALILSLFVRDGPPPRGRRKRRPGKGAWPGASGYFSGGGGGGGCSGSSSDGGSGGCGGGGGGGGCGGGGGA